MIKTENGKNRENEGMKNLVLSEDYERSKRIIVRTEAGKITLCSTIDCERIAVTEPFGKLELFIDLDDTALQLLLDGKKFVTIEHPVEGQAYPVPEIAGAYADNTYVFVNDIFTPHIFTAITDRRIEATVLRDRVIIDLYNMTANTLTFADADWLTVIADLDEAIPGAVITTLKGDHTEVECDAIARQLMARSELYKYYSAKGELEHFYRTVFLESGEKGFFEAFQI